MNSGVIRDTVQILGSVTANSILTPATIGGSAANVLNASSSISSQGFAKFVSASIAGFVVNTEEIKSSNDNLRLKSTGQITASAAQISGNITATSGKIAEFNIQSDANTSASIRTNTGTSLIFAGTNTFGASGVHIATNDAFTNPRFFVGQGTGANIKFDNGNLTVSSSNFVIDNSGNITLDGVVKAGAIGNRAVTITSSNLAQYVSSNVLYLDGSQGGDAATFARFNVAAEIKQIVVNDSGEFDSANVILEDAADGLVIATTGGSGNNKINIDSTSAFAPENSRGSNKLRVGERLGSGTRVLLTRSASDWKVHSLERESKGNEGFIKRSAQLVLPTGSATYPALSFGTTNEFHNGFYMNNNSIHVVTNNSDNFLFNNDGAFRVPNGSEASPAIQFGSNQDGFYHLTSGDAGINVLVNDIQEFLFADGGGFHADGDITAFSTTTDSDIRLKENIIPLENNLEKVLQLKPSSFRWKIQDRENDIGLIAQDVEKVIPELVKEKSSIGKTKELLDGDKHKTVDYSKLTTLLIGAVQEQQKQIDELKKKLEEL